MADYSGDPFQDWYWYKGQTPVDLGAPASDPLALRGDDIQSPGGAGPLPLPPPPPPPPPHKVGETGLPPPEEVAGAPQVGAAGGDLEDPYAAVLGFPSSPTPRADTLGQTQPGTGLPAGLVRESLGIPAPGETVEMPAEDLSDEAQQRQLDELSVKDPLAFQQKMFDFEQEAREGTNADQRLADAELTKARAGEDAARRVTEGMIRAQHDSMHIDAEARRLANEKIDASGWRTPGNTIRAIIMGVIGGMYQGRTGGAENMGLKMIDQEIDRYVDGQKATLASRVNLLGQRRSALADALSRTGDMYKAEEAVRQAAYHRVLAEVQSDMQKFDPRGYARMKHAELVGQLNERLLQGREAARRRSFDEYVKVAPIAQAERKQAFEESKYAAAHSAVGGSGVDDKQVLSAEEWARRYGIAVPPQLQGMQLSGKQFADVVGKGLDLQKKGAEVEGTAQERTVYDVAGNPLFQTSKDDAAKLRAAQPGTVALIGGLEQLRKLREREGGASKYLDPGTVADYNQIANQVVGNYAAANNLSLSDKQSQDFARDIVLGGDPTDYRVGDLEKRIRKAQQSAEDAYNNKLIAAGYHGERQKLVAAEKERSGTTPDIDVIRQREGNANLGDASKDYSAPQKLSSEFK